jgi:hypothetical protein
VAEKLLDVEFPNTQYLFLILMLEPAFWMSFVSKVSRLVVEETEAFWMPFVSKVSRPAVEETEAPDTRRRRTRSRVDFLTVWLFEEPMPQGDLTLLAPQVAKAIRNGTCSCPCIFTRSG